MSIGQDGGARQRRSYGLGLCRRRWDINPRTPKKILQVIALCIVVFQKPPQLDDLGVRDGLANCWVLQCWLRFIRGLRLLLNVDSDLVTFANGPYNEGRHCEENHSDAVAERLNMTWGENDAGCRGGTRSWNCIQARTRT